MVAKKRKGITIRALKSKREIEKWGSMTPQNLEKIIWDSIDSYNYRAQLDIAQMLLEKYEILSKEYKVPPSNPVVKNICLRIQQLFFETADQFAIVCMAIIEKHSKPVFETYVRGENVKTRTFFKRCAAGEVSDEEIKKIWGLDVLEKAKITDTKAKRRVERIIKETVNIERKNLKGFGETYAEYDKETGSTSYTPAVKGAFAIKHGFKLVNPSSLSKKLWDIGDANPTVMQELIEVTRDDTKETKVLLVVGSLLGGKIQNIDKALEKLFKLIRFLSDEIKLIATIQKGKTEDPFFVIKLFHKGGIIKIGRNELCPCGSGKKFKKCHRS